MPFIDTPEPAAAAPLAAKMHERARRSFGYLPNMVRAFGQPPEVQAAWNVLIGAVHARIVPRRYELATLAAARTLGSSCCMLAHGRMLLGQGVSETDLIGIAEAAADAPQTETERALTDYAATVARDAGAVGPETIAGLRALGLSDSDIFDIAAAARCFFSKVLDALGALPDAAYGELSPDLRAALAIGRPIDGG